VWQKIYHFGGLIHREKGCGGALTISQLKWSKGWISTINQEEHVVLDLKLQVKVTLEGVRVPK
jgi:hypothetical protein